VVDAPLQQPLNLEPSAFELQVNGDAWRGKSAERERERER